jgi:EAL domain-containing protein (putative c-di-GMP-specific phosphodiesterase class I)
LEIVAIQSDAKDRQKKNLIHAHSGDAAGLKVVAEGVETAAQVERLTFLKCDFVQGYFFSKPTSATGITTLLGKYQNGLLPLTSQ